jgi:hypothetical protein
MRTVCTHTLSWTRRLKTSWAKPTMRSINGSYLLEQTAGSIEKESPVHTGDAAENPGLNKRLSHSVHKEEMTGRFYHKHIFGRPSGDDKIPRRPGAFTRNTTDGDRYEKKTPSLLCTHCYLLTAVRLLNILLCYFTFMSSRGCICLGPTSDYHRHVI